MCKMELKIFELVGALMGRNLKGENLVGGIDPGGIRNHDIDSLEKSTKVDDLGACGVQNYLSCLLPRLHVIFQASDQANI